MHRHNDDALRDGSAASLSRLTTRGPVPWPPCLRRRREIQSTMGLPSVARSSPRHMLCRTSTDLSIKKPVDGRPPLPRWSLCASATSRGTFRPIGPT